MTAPACELEIAHDAAARLLAAADRRRFQDLAGDAGRRRRWSGSAGLPDGGISASTRPRAACSRTRRSNGSSTPGPVPQVKWKRGTELPWPCARPPPRSAQPTTGNQRMPMRVQPWPHLAGGEVDKGFGDLARPEILAAGRTAPSPSSPASASARLSRMRMRRCSGLSTKNRPPSDQKAWPPSEFSPSCSRMMTLLPASPSSAAATSPAGRRRR